MPNAPNSPWSNGFSLGFGPYTAPQPQPTPRAPIIGYQGYPIGTGSLR